MKYALTVLWLFSFFLAYTQQTGDISFSVNYQGLSRNVEGWVPPGYDGSREYGAIVALHGFSMTAGTMRQAVKPVAQSEGLLLFCLDGNGNRHDDEMGGNEIYLLESLMDSIYNRFNLDSCRVYLSGFSYGGREALYFGMHRPNLFAGIIPFAPAIQSTADAQNQLAIPWSNPFDFNKAKDIPSCICYGENDANFRQSIEAFIDEMDGFNAKDTAIIAMGVGHTLGYSDFESNFQSCLDYVVTHPKSACETVEDPTGLKGEEPDSEKVRLVRGDEIHIDSEKVKRISVFNSNGAEIYRGSEKVVPIPRQYKNSVLLILMQLENGKYQTQKLAW